MSVINFPQPPKEDAPPSSCAMKLLTFMETTEAALLAIAKNCTDKQTAVFAEGIAKTVRLMITASTTMAALEASVLNEMREK